jgi:Sap, sulfolipid-1-addressing protein
VVPPPATVTQAKLSTAGSYLTLMAFCLLATSSLLYLEIYMAVAPAAASSRLERLRAWLETHQDQVVVAVCLLLGLWLAGKSIYLLVS